MFLVPNPDDSVPNTNDPVPNPGDLVPNPDDLVLNPDDPVPNTIDLVLNTDGLFATPSLRHFFNHKAHRGKDAEDTELGVSFNRPFYIFHPFPSQTPNSQLQTRSTNSDT
ncbi:hypothetical protein SAMN04488024_102369 [Pedobacter soli]|uniref:Uncharacterized protein n=1 Tax=Pedobacter soli TaxID=390242 RepID=A0A1G6MLY0_9SPHI|nr:hypothetical protein SAMN04488024_102369 [Pedobacter soli]